MIILSAGGFNSIDLLSSNRDIFPPIQKEYFWKGQKKLKKYKFLPEDDLLIRSVPDYSAAVKDLLKIKETDKIFVIGTSDKVGQAKTNIFKKVISGLDKKIEVEYLLDNNMHQICEKLSNKNDSAIAFLPFNAL